MKLEGANPFRIRAYRNAARTIGGLATEAYVLVEKDEDLTILPGIGRDLSDKIKEIVSTDHCGLLDRLRKEFPPAVTELLRIPGLGPKRVRHLYHDLDVQTVEQLYSAARDRAAYAHCPGSAKKWNSKFSRRLNSCRTDRRFKLAMAAQYAEALRSYLGAAPGVKQVTVAGSFRRMRETVATSTSWSPPHPTARNAEFTAYDEIAEILVVGPTRASILLKCGMQVDLRVVPEESYGAALHYFTGSKSHNIAVRQIARKRGLK